MLSIPARRRLDFDTMPDAIKAKPYFPGYDRESVQSWITNLLAKYAPETIRLIKKPTFFTSDVTALGAYLNDRVPFWYA
jgi:ABC-type proline/glycine betaine transport system substrate-binding protein